MSITRCQIYCRTSSDEGLSQDFNSLDAQTEACEAFIKSQAALSWRNQGQAIHDGGYSGGSMDRPELQKLLDNVRSGLIDCIVVYKVDRLTRSLADFAQLVELLDKHQVSFVSVTQQFNTTSSMGRLTLNVLLSFAQFEREVTAERIRDKVAASKQKGMWMGGVCPLGYEPDGRTLKIVPDQANVVQDLFNRYERLRSVPALVQELRANNIKSPRRKLLTGRTIGGGNFEKGHLYNLLKNPIYIGQIRHKGQVYDGEHEGIIGRDQFERVQQIFQMQTRRKRSINASRSQQDYRGRVFDENGQKMLNSQTIKGGKQYRYYISPKTSPANQKVSAAKLEQAVSDVIDRLKRDPAGLVNWIGTEVKATTLEQIAQRLDPFNSIYKITVSSDGHGSIMLDDDIFDGLNTVPTVFDFNFTPAANSRKGRVAKSASIYPEDNGPTAYQVHLETAFKIWDTWQTSPELTSAQLAAKLNMDRSRMTRVLRLRFLSPRIMKHIQTGKLLSIGAEDLVRTAPPEDWFEQEEWLLAA